MLYFTLVSALLSKTGAAGSPAICAIRSAIRCSRFRCLSASLAALILCLKREKERALAFPWAWWQTDRQTDRQMRKLNIPDLHLHELGDKRRQIDRQTGKLHNAYSWHVSPWAWWQTQQDRQTDRKAAYSWHASPWAWWQTQTDRQTDRKAVYSWTASPWAWW